MFLKKRKSIHGLTAWLFIAIVFLLLPPLLSAYQVSAAGGCSVPNSDPDAKGFYDSISSLYYWSGNYYAKYTNCLESQYKGILYGGNDDNWLDKSDIHYHISHGDRHHDAYYNRDIIAVMFDLVDSAPPPDLKYLDASEARNSWGNIQLDWIGFRNCQLLSDPSSYYWKKTMNWSRLILGFKSNSYVQHHFGAIWAWKMKRRYYGYYLPWTFYYYSAYTISHAWNSTCDWTQPWGTRSRIIAAHLIYFNDHLHTQGYVMPPVAPNSKRCTWDHYAFYPWFWWWVPSSSGQPLNGKETGTNSNELAHARSVELSEIYRLEVVPRAVDQTYVQSIAAAFGFAADDPLIEDDDFFQMARPTEDNLDPEDPSNPSYRLTVFKKSGIYAFYHSGKMWKLETDEQGEPIIPGIYPEGSAESTAYDFLTDPAHVNLYPSDVYDYYVGSDRIVIEDDDTGEYNEYNILRSVAYSRAVEGQAGIELPVVGAGARIKVYLDEDGSIIGAQGNWRQVQPAGTVNVITKNEAWSNFLSNGMDAALPGIYLSYDDAQTDLESATLGYYEKPGINTQDELIPVWIFTVTFYKDGVAYDEPALIYIPAQAE